MLDERVRAVLDRLEREDAAERKQGLPREQRARAVEPTTGRFLFALVAPQTGCEVLEIGGSRGYSAVWLAAAAPPFGGRRVPPQHHPPQNRGLRPDNAHPGPDEVAPALAGRCPANLRRAA